MPHTPTDYDRIIAYLGEREHLSRHDRDKIESWILQHSDETALNESFLRVWAAIDPQSDSINMKGLLRLLRAVEDKDIYIPPQPHRNRGLVWRTIAAASTLVALLLGALHFLRVDLSQPDIMLVTAAGSIGEFTLPDSSHVWLNGGSTLTYSRNFSGGGTRKVKVDGEAFFNVTHDPAHPFIVDMTEMQVEVVGTSFEVRNYRTCHSSEIILSEGCVKVRGPWGDDEVAMKPDQMLTLDRGAEKAEVRSTDASTYCRWFEQFPTFDDEPITNILINVSRRYGLDLRIDPDVDTSYRMSVTMGGETFESIMTVLTYLSPIDYHVDDNILYITAK